MATPGTRREAQFDMREPATQNTHLPTLEQVRNLIADMEFAAADLVLTTPLTASYNATNKTLTAGADGELIVDGVAALVGTSVLIAGQPDMTQNGTYVVTIEGDASTAAELTRRDDMNESAHFVNGKVVPVTSGTANANTRWKLTVGAIPFVLDSTTAEFTKAVTDFTKVVEMTFPVEGDAATTIYTFAHNLDTRNVTHELYDDATGETVEAMFRRNDANTASVLIGEPLGVGNDLTLVIRAQVDPV